MERLLLPTVALIRTYAALERIGDGEKYHLRIGPLQYFHVDLVFPGVEEVVAAEFRMADEQAEQNRRAASLFEGERRRLLRFIERRIPLELDAEDLLQEVFAELIEAYRAMKPIAHAGNWMMQVAQNRITDWFRRGRREVSIESGDERVLADLLPSPEAGPDALYARAILMEQIEAALEELPASQRAVFLGHELEGLSFAEMAEQTGLSVNTLLSRKRYAVQRLRLRLDRFRGEI